MPAAYNLRVQDSQTEPEASWPANGSDAAELPLTVPAASSHPAVVETPAPAASFVPIDQPSHLPEGLPVGSVYAEGKMLAPAGFSLRLRAFLLDWLLLSACMLVVASWLDLPPRDPERELKLSLQAFQRLSSGQLPSTKLLQELAELQQPRRLLGWLNLACSAVYFISFTYLVGTTPGKALLGLMVRRRDGTRPGLGLAGGRYLCYLLCSRLLYGTFTMPFDSQRRCLHDLLCGTNVYRELRWR